MSRSAQLGVALFRSENSLPDRPGCMYVYVTFLGIASTVPTVWSRAARVHRHNSLGPCSICVITFVLVAVAESVCAVAWSWLLTSFFPIPEGDWGFYIGNCFERVCVCVCVCVCVTLRASPRTFFFGFQKNGHISAYDHRTASLFWQ